MRDGIAAEVLDRGWNPELGCFTTACGGPDLDAATLHIGLSGLLAPDDERFRATVTAIEAELRSGSTVYRYNRDDALPGGEGGFHPRSTSRSPSALWATTRRRTHTSG